MNSLNTIIDLLNSIKVSVDTIKNSLESWFGPGGMYSKTLRVYATRWRPRCEWGDKVVTLDSNVVVDVKITIGFTKDDPTAIVYFGYDIGGGMLLTLIEKSSPVDKLSKFAPIIVS